MPLMKSSAMCQKARLPAALASLSNGHSSDLHACCVGMRFLSRPNLVPAMPSPSQCGLVILVHCELKQHCVKARACHLPIARTKARAIADYCQVATTTLAHNLIWPSNSSVLSRYMNSFLVSPSLASKPMRRKLSLCSSCLGTSVRVSIAQLTTWFTFLVIIVVHLGSFANVILIVTVIAALCSIN